MRKYATLDAETDPFEFGEFPEPFIWGLYHDDGYEEFNTIAEVAEFLKDKDWVVYAHNGGRFDFVFLAEYFNEEENILLINGRIAKAKIGTCELRDSYCILPIPLREINKDDFDYMKMKKDVRHLHMKEIKKYLYNDCYYLYEAIKAFRDNYGDAVTIASAAMKQWRAISGKTTERTYQNYFNEISPFYHGGRVECFEGGIIKDSIQLFDINSAYPHAMIHDHPAGKEYYRNKFLPKTDDQIKMSLIVIECESHGQFAIKTKTGTQFPNDGIRRVYNTTGWEYLAARDTSKLGNEPKILWCYTFGQKINFSEYVEKFFALKDQAKKDGDKHQYIFAKLFLNSLYGKFGSNPSRYKEYQIAHVSKFDSMIEDGWDLPCNHFNDKFIFQKNLEENKQRFYNVATAASITGFVRANLLRAISNCERPLYCDTDSIMCIGEQNLNIGQKLGQWDLETNGSEVAICGKKLYALKKENGSFKIATKGAKLKAQDIFKIARGEIVNYKNEAPSMSLNAGKKFVERNIKMTYKKIA